MRRVEIAALYKATLKDIRSVHFEDDASFQDRARRVLTQIGNPYAFVAGEVTVKIEYNEGGRSLTDALASYLTSIRYTP